MNKIACVNIKDSHLLDHIAPLSFILDSNLYIEEEKNFSLVKNLYPFIKSVKSSPIDFVYLAKKYDFLFECKFWINTSLYKTFYNEKLKFIFSPHGNSDKGHIKNDLLKAYSSQDAVLLYGDHMIDMLKKYDVFKSLKSYVICGNYRLSYYLHFKEFYDQKVYDDIFKNLDPRKKTIIYAPTWKDLENSTSFFDIYSSLLESFNEKYNLIIKIHPLLEERNPKEFYKIINQKFLNKNIVQLIDYPLVYPILNKCDIYLGDFSSIGYDFLYFDRPMFFLKKQNQESSYLQKCGITIEEKYFSNIFNFIDKNLDKNFSNIKKETYEYAFGKTFNINQIKKNIIKLF